MPRGNPAYRLHKTKGQAIVTLNGRMIYLGPHGSPESYAEYARVMAEWRAGNGYVAPARGHAVTIADLVLGFLRFAEKYSRKERDEFTLVGKALCATHAQVSVAEFGPRAFKAVRQTWVDAGNSRGVINQRAGRIMRMFAWGVENELVGESMHRALALVSRLSYGEAREPDKIRPADTEHVRAMLPHLPAPLRAVAELQILTGARGGELLILRPCDLDRTGDVWIYRPARHKTRHHGQECLRYLGPQAQAILLPWLEGAELAEYVFRPVHGGRKGEPYWPHSYTTAVYRACKLAGVPRMHPHRLRHLAGTEIRRLFGLEAAQVLLGHATLSMTEHYAAKNMELAKDVARKVG